MKTKRKPNENQNIAIATVSDICMKTKRKPNENQMKALSKEVKNKEKTYSQIFDSYKAKIVNLTRLKSREVH